MRIKQYCKILLIINFFLLITNAFPKEVVKNVFTYSIRNKIELKAYVFTLDSLRNKENLPVIVIFYGGGWSIGEPSWSFGIANHYAKLGFVAVAAQYRLSNQKDITPVDAMEDAREMIEWIRMNKNLLKIDPNKIVGYGWSAGAHLVASAAIFPDIKSKVSSSPNAMILISPAISLEKDYWFKKLLKNKVDVKKLSPVENIKKGLPPTLILQGSEDTVTPLSGAKNFTNKMKQNGNICELIVYDGVGHLFTTDKGHDNRFRNPDPKIMEQAHEKADDFLKSLGYLK